MIYEASNGQKITYEIIRKKNKNLYFRVKEDLKLYIYAPIYMTQHTILKYLKENEKAILKMYEKREENREDINIYKYLGKKYYIKIDADITEVKFTASEVLTPSLEVLDEYTKKMINKVYEEEINLCKRCFSTLPEFTWKTRFMKTRWGVCNTKTKQITLNTELIKKDVDLLEYVIIHELCHFFEPNHSKAFWSLVSQAFPKYKEARQRLKE